MNGSEAVNRTIHAAVIAAFIIVAIAVSDDPVDEIGAQQLEQALQADAADRDAARVAQALKEGRAGR